MRPLDLCTLINAKVMMSQSLTLSSLFATFAMVLLCLGVRAGELTLPHYEPTIPSLGQAYEAGASVQNAIDRFVRPLISK